MKKLRILLSIALLAAMLLSVGCSADTTTDAMQPQVTENTPAEAPETQMPAEETPAQTGSQVADASQMAPVEDVVEAAELKTMLAESLELLTEKERRVIELYYYEDMTLKEISKILSVSESRVSQLHTKALLKMRKKMGPYMNILTD